MNRHGSMNRIYRLVWSAVRNVWIPVAETARGRGKRSTPKLIVAALSLTCAIAQASPSGGQVVAGTGGITQAGAITTITQATQNLSLTWASFNIAPQQTVNFVQPSTSAIAVNRVLGTNGTQILGYLHANGQVFLINPNGIVFGPTAEVNVGGLVASTLDLGTGLAGNAKSFSGMNTGSVVNQGTITAAQGGYVVLLGNHVSNEGVISAQLGTVALGAGSAVTLTFEGNSRVRLQVDESVLNSLAENGGLIRADGGQVIMSAGARDALMASVVNNSGVIEARTVDTHGGTISLLAGMAAGTVNIAGTLDASAPQGGNGGQIDTSAAHVEVAGGARITTAARNGLFGSWLIDPEDFTVAASGGDITGTTLSSDLGTTDIVLQSSSGTMAPGGLGDVNVNDAVTWSANTTLTLTASNNVNVNANITASGATAGLVINPNTGNGSGILAQLPTGSGTFNLTGASITLTGATPFLSIGGTTYTVINTLGMPGSMTATDLQGMNGNLAGNYALGSNIDASATATDSAWISNGGFTPIGGGGGAAFSGIFDGLGHTISGLTINLPTGYNVGLFGYTSPASIVQNVGLVAGSVTGDQNVGGLIGNNYGTVRNSYTTGSVSGTGVNTVNVGGLIGYNFGAVLNSNTSGNVSGTGNNLGGLVGYNFGTVFNSYATGAVSGFGNSVGGLVGSSEYGVINTSYAIGAVSGANNVGGLVGNSGYTNISNSYATGSVISYQSVAGGLVGYSTQSAISDSYATGSVSGYVYAAGLIGINISSTLSNSYSTGTVTGIGSPGGLVGYNSGAISDSYWNTSANPTIPGVGAGSSTGATGLTTAQMQNTANFAGFTFTATPGVVGNYWVMVDTDGTLNNAAGASGATFPMLSSEYSTTVANAHELQLIEMALGANYTLSANVNAAGTDTSTTLGDVWSTAGGFVPIGSYSANFTGSFDGMGHTISGLTINTPTAANVGLFGYTGVNAIIQNVGLLGGSVAGNNSTGDLVGDLRGTLTQSYATGDVTGTSANEVGGLAGINNRGTIDNSYANGNVTGGTNVGGLVGYNYGTVLNIHATGNVTATGGNAGGLVGTSVGGPISNSYATGAVTGTSSVGGLVGLNVSATIANSYATGNVSSSSAYGGGLGGLVGDNDGGAISSSRATGNVTGSSNIGGLVGYNYAGAISGSDSTGTVTGATGGSNVGGLVGFNTSTGTVASSFASGAVSGTGNLGGLVGNNYGGTIAGSRASGTVTGTSGSSSVGGLVGYNYGSALITTSNATGVVAGETNVGGLVGSNFGSILNSYASGDVSSSSVSAGGLVGHNAGGTISYSNATGTVTGSNYVGGLVGFDSGTISFSFARGAVSGSNYVGGLVGSGSGAISDSQASGDVTSAGSSIGGLVGIYQSGTINGSVASGSVSGSGLDVGGLVGNNAGGSIYDSGATGNVTGMGSATGGLVGYNGTGLISGGFASGVVQGATDTGGLVGKNYGEIDGSYASGSTTGTNNVGGLVGFNRATVVYSDATNTVNGNFVVGGLVGYNYGGIISNSNASGNVTSASGRVGGLAGNNYGGNAQISNSYATGNVNGSGYGVGGLVGANGNTIINSHATGTVVDTGDAVGGLVGHNYGPVSNSYATGHVNGSGYGVGGLIGYNSSAVSNTYATGSVNGGDYGVGGLVGKNVGQGAISNSYANGNVHGEQFAGGLVGANYGAISNSYATGNVSGTGNNNNGGLVGDNTSTIVNSYATGTVSGSGNLGGLVGSNYGVIVNTYATGSVTGTGSLGGLVGHNGDEIEFSYFNSNIAGVGIGSGANAGADGLTTAGMMTMSNFSFSQWNISDTGGSGSVWRIYEGNTAPLLSSFLTPLTVTALNQTHTYTDTSAASLIDASFSVSGAATSGHIFNINNAYNGETNVGTYVPALYSDQLGYDMSYVNAELTITPATLTVTANGASRSYGRANPTLSGAVTGFVGSDTLANATTGAETYAAAATASSNVGTYAITASGLTADNGNYTFSFAAANATAFSITPATLTVTANGTSRIYGQANPTLSGAVTGFMGSDTLATATTGAETYATAAIATSNVGNYAITGSGLTADNGNYTFSFATANATAFSITPATLTVTANGTSRIYGQANPTLSGAVTGFMGSDTLATATTGAETYATAAIATSNVGNYAITGSGLTADNGNYTFSFAAANATAFNITPATLTYTAATASFTAGQTPSGLTGTLAGFVAGDTELNATTGSLAWTTTAGAGSAAGRYAIDGSGLTATNYVFVDAAANATALMLLTPISPPSGPPHPSAPGAAALLQAQNAVTSIEVNLPSSQTNIQLAMLAVPASIAVTHDVDTDVATEPADNIVTDKRSVHGGMVPSLRVVRGGVKLPDDRVNLNVR